jgi:hypothetical protein
VRERKIVALMNVHEHGLSIIPSIVEGNNRIGMEVRSVNFAGTVIDNDLLTQAFR